MTKRHDAAKAASRRTGERWNVAPLFRAAEILSVRAATEDEAARIEVSFSSEEPCERWFGTEILGHRSGEVRMDWIASGHAPFLVDHDRSAEAQIGVVETASLKNGRGVAVIRMSRTDRAQAILADIEDGVRTNISVGYRVHEMTLQSSSEENKTYRVTDWEPFEVSLVTVPADTSVGVGRTVADENICIIIEEIEEGDETMVKKTEESGRKKSEADAVPAATADAGGRMDAEALRKKAAEDAVRAERKRVEEITALAARHNRSDMVARAISEGVSVERFRGMLLDAYGDTPATSPVASSAAIGMSDSEARGYSFLRAMRAAMSNNWSDAGFERECSDAVARRMGRTTTGFFVPEEVQMQGRDITIGGAATGADLVGTDHVASAFIDLYRNRLMVRRAGARVMGGLDGNVSIPRQAGGSSASWLADENADAPQSEASFDDVTLTPRTAAAHSVISRQLLMQSSPDVEALVRADLAAAAAQAVDSAAIAGSGSSGVPRGILATTGIGIVDIAADGGAPQWQHIVALETAVAVDNADVGALAYMTNARVRGKLKTTPKESGQPIYIWTDTPAEAGIGMVNGYSAYATNQVPADLTKGSGTNLSAILFGNWSDLLIGEWGALEVLVNPYSLDTSGKVRITVFKSVDVAVRHAASFAAIKDAATS